MLRSRSLLYLQRRYSSTSHSGWEAVIGIEVHAQINCKTKLFSGSPTSFNAPVNTNVSVIDAAYPGVQPKLNKEAVDLGIKTALALQADIQPTISFDRKHYFYPDLPQGYQITQHREPLARGGHIDLLALDGLEKDIRVGIHQLQLEQDTGKSNHDMEPGSTCLDLNRAGSGLMEIVTKPDMRSALEAGILVKKLQAMLRSIGSSKANMEEGSMRCDVNVSVHKPNEPFGARCELKNLNSVRFLTLAVDAEIRRQVQLIEAGQQVEPETRGYDVVAGKTFKLRGKESTPDYRYMPEPDLPPLRIDKTHVQYLATTIPELPDQCRVRIMDQYKLALADANVLLNEPGCLDYFEKLCVGRTPKSVVNWTLHELFGQLSSQNISFSSNPVSAEQLGSLIDLVQKGTITGPTGKSVLKWIVQEKSTQSPDTIVQAKGWARIGDIDTLRQMCQDLIAKHPDKADTIKQGNPKMFKWFIGQAMKSTKGMADPIVLNKALSLELGVDTDGKV
ncbi:Aspartyl/glutamyl-tRNA amidotransferase subunit B [Hesseltinella vesiculosa]|uniref:Glutamyl-tRNA(Gln) amidotransferase subunit B, mitochondrial n=1 Tax=Hesseltinella vesiculosa TaxID=101127 RepID=A0A1X2GJQ9_9FUNG|nr:Aspartyl/glutamyl-tRNA amidotransferase subunit B [Hesseltinella vesiculosa]